jgi:hypothetical protein
MICCSLSSSKPLAISMLLTGGPCDRRVLDFVLNTNFCVGSPSLQFSCDPAAEAQDDHAVVAVAALTGPIWG